MAVMGFDVFDGDGHVLENDDEIASYFEGDFANLQRFKTFGVWPSLDGWARGFIMASNDGEPRRYTHTDAKVWGERKTSAKDAERKKMLNERGWTKDLTLNPLAKEHETS